MTSKKIVILPCAGHGSRFGSTIPKQYTLINGKTILEHTLNVFLPLAQIDQIIIVTASDDQYIDNLLTAQSNLINHAKIQILKIGGASRAHTVKNAINSINCNSNDWLLVHDVARCCITAEAVLRLILKLEDNEVGGILAINAADTIKQSKNGQLIDKTLDRSTIYQAQTPQMFRIHILKDALNGAKLDLVTDEASAVEQMGLPVKLVEGDVENIKITYPADIRLAEIILNSRL
ncbi:MAG TPA: 2-C-methyl-D-erythritol 4-phosphate cytidylyltransferase [Aquella sp.]|nr:2-C-methyl-D-erythritol 4-phosphate cytidylyltransferase [Aquella sp.]